MEEIIRTIVTILGASAITASIVLIVIRFLVNRTADALEKKYELKLNKELEDYKNELQKGLNRQNASIENSLYVSKALFDVKINVYQKLSSSFFDVVFYANCLIPAGVNKALADPEERKKVDNENYMKLNNAVVAAQSLLHSNIPFITFDQYERYRDLLKMASLQLDAFSVRRCVSDFRSQAEKESLPSEAYQRSRDITSRFEELSKELAEYLSSLQVLE